MQTSKLNEWLGLSANIGVLLGILILVVEISQNTRATEAQVTWEHNNSVRELYYPIIMDPILSPIATKLRASTESEVAEVASENSPEYAQYSLWYAIQMNMWEARYYTQVSDVERERLRSLIITLSTANEIDKYLAVNNTVTRFRPEFTASFKSIQLEIKSL
jgi:hypothetical protein